MLIFSQLGDIPQLGPFYFLLYFNKKTAYIFSKPTYFWPVLQYNPPIQGEYIAAV
jgi:hypothetical protein